MGPNLWRDRMLRQSDTYGTIYRFRQHVHKTTLRKPIGLIFVEKKIIFFRELTRNFRELTRNFRE